MASKQRNQTPAEIAAAAARGGWKTTQALINKKNKTQAEQYAAAALIQGRGRQGE